MIAKNPVANLLHRVYELDSFPLVQQAIGDLSDVVLSLIPASAKAAAVSVSADSSLTGATATNTGSGGISKGDIIGLDSSGNVAKALAGSSIIKGRAISLNSAGAGATLNITSRDFADVNIETGTTPVPGDTAYLSETFAGSATPIRPSSIQIMGTFYAVKDQQGKARILLNIDNHAGGAV